MTTRFTMVRGILLAGCALLVTQAWASAYLLDEDGHPVRNERGQCWRTVEWRPDLALAECDPLYWRLNQQKKQRADRSGNAANATGDTAAKAAEAAPGAAATDKPSAASTMSPAEEYVEEVELEPLVLNTDTSFRFGDYRLTPEARSALQELAGILESRQAEELHLKITGHTDRIGSAAANQVLGLKRAQAIKDALVAMGIPAQNIEVFSKGASEPVTQKDDCPANLVKCELIECLRPDRRVVIDTRARVSVHHKVLKPTSSATVQPPVSSAGITP